MKNLKGQIIAFLFLLCRSSVVFAQFTPGNLAVVRVGTGDSSLTSAAAPVFIDEYTPAGSFISALPLPVCAGGPNFPLTLAGSALSEGALSRSPDGRYIALAGYAAEPGTASVSSSSTSTVNRVIASIDASGNINSSTRLKSLFSGSNIRGAATCDGAGFWCTGNSSGSSGAGIVYAALGDTCGVRIIDEPNNTRCISVFNEELYATSGTGGYKNIFRIGSGLPVTAGQSGFALPGMDSSDGSPYAFSIDPGCTVCYVADSRSIANGGGVQKWVFHDTAWTLSSTFTGGITTGVYGLAVDWSGEFPKIYATTSGRIVQFIDSGSVSPTGITIATAFANTAFRGISLAPISTQSGIGEAKSMPRLELLQNHPNPFNPETRIEFILPAGARRHVSLKIYDILGREVAELLNGEKPAGLYNVRWNAAGNSGGVYFCRLTAGKFSATRKMLLVR